MSQRLNIASGTKWEEIVGYSRAVKIGNTIEISGTVSVDSQGIVGKGNPYKQTKFILQKIEQILEKAGGSMSAVVRTRMFVTDIVHWEEIGKAHGEYFKDIRPVTTMVEVSSLIDRDLLVEIEATAIITD